MKQYICDNIIINLRNDNIVYLEILDRFSCQLTFTEYENIVNSYEYIKEMRDIKIISRGCSK